MGRNFVIVGLGAERLRLRRGARDEEVRRKTARRWIQRYGFAFEMENREMRGVSGGEMDLVVQCGTERVVSELQPFEAGEGEPAIRLQEIFDVLRAPCGEVLLPRRVLRESGYGEKSAERGDEQRLPEVVAESHVGL